MRVRFVVERQHGKHTKAFIQHKREASTAGNCIGGAICVQDRSVLATDRVVEVPEKAHARNQVLYALQLLIERIHTNSEETAVDIVERRAICYEIPDDLLTGRIASSPKEAK